MPGLSKSRSICLIARLALAAQSIAADVDYLRDIKPALNKYAGKTFEETPFKDFLDKDRIEKNLAGQGMTIHLTKSSKV
tara:strand:- start:1387 stop:1623 length:237 start_codon:yes stop_codon:yes gene_type:complete